jgi:hypothetical protein
MINDPLTGKISPAGQRRHGIKTLSSGFSITTAHNQPSFPGNPAFLNT